MRFHACLLIALVVASPVLAQPAGLPANARAIEMSGHLQGDMALYGLSVEGGFDWLALRGHGSYEHVEEHGYFVPDGAGGSTLVPSPEDPVWTDSGERDFDLQLVAAGPDAQIHLIPSDARVVVDGDAVDVFSEPEGCLTGSGIDYVGPNDCSGLDEDIAQFSPVPLPPSLVLQTASQVHMTITGDLVLELVDIDLRDGGDHVEGRNARSSAPAGEYTVHFYRYTLEDVVLDLDLDGADQLSWAADDAVVDVSRGKVRIQEGSGKVDTALGKVDVAESDLVGDIGLIMAPAGDQVAFDTTPGVTTASAGHSMVASVGWGWGLAGLASLAPMIGVMLLVNRLRNDTTMQDVERALDQGEFGRAERLARRILRGEPLNESARLSLSIALTKLGRQQQAVENLQGYLAEHDPADGTLHYVLGLALIDMERDEDARKAIDEAIRITPQLADQVEAYVRSTEVGYA